SRYPNAPAPNCSATGAHTGIAGLPLKSTSSPALGWPFVSRMCFWTAGRTSSFSSLATRGPLGLSPPFRRPVAVGTAGGQAAFTFPDDGEVSLLITDYREYYYLPASPIGFWAPSVQRNVLGLTGFLQYFSMEWFNDGQTIPEVELTENP